MSLVVVPSIWRSAVYQDWSCQLSHECLIVCVCGCFLHMCACVSVCVNLKDGQISKLCVCASATPHALQIWYSDLFLNPVLQRIICCCVRGASCQTWCDGTKTTLMMVDSRKGQQVVQLVDPVLRGRNIIKRNVSLSRLSKSSFKAVVVVQHDVLYYGSTCWSQVDASWSENTDEYFSTN